MRLLVLTAGLLLLLLLLLPLCCSGEENLCDKYGSYVCANGGTCVKTGTGTFGYECRCAPGFSGPTCRGSSDICVAFAPCFNNGTCANTQEGYFACTCPPGITGRLCHINIDDCKPDPCVHGTCIDRVNAYQCHCHSGWTGTNCDADENECARDTPLCHANAKCTNLVGSFSCACKPGYYGDGYNMCAEIVVLPTTNATRLGEHDFNHYGISNKTFELDTPVLIGEKEESVFRVGKDGYISFGQPAYQSRYPTYYRYITKPVLFPYWSYNLQFVDAEAAVHVEQLSAESDSSHENFRSTAQAVRQFNASFADFDPTYVLLVTWTRLRPYNYYDYYCRRYCRYYYEVRNYTWAQYYCKYCNVKAEHLTFQAVVARNDTHSLAMFNYGQFELQRYRWRWYYAAAGFTDGFRKLERLHFSYNYWRRDSLTDNLQVGNTGKRGRHLIAMATGVPPSPRQQCERWINNDEQQRQNLRVELNCTTCPPDMRVAMLDWRYRPYQYSCDRREGSSERYQLNMCFRGRYDCVQEFGNYTCPWRWDWWCRNLRCQYMHAPRCCYKMNMNWRRDGQLVDYCKAGYSIWTLRWKLRNKMLEAERNETNETRSGQLVSSTRNGAGHSMLMEKQRGSWWFNRYDEQLRNETHGYDVCREATMFGKYRKRRPKCNAAGYEVPVMGFNRGDPHISTLDGTTYSFNGLCEYYMLQNRSGDYPLLELQSRTRLAKSLNPSVTSRATVFSGFGLKAGSNNVSVAAVISGDANDIDVYVGSAWLGSVLANFSANDNGTEVEGYSIKADDNSSVSISEQDTGFSIIVTLNRNLSLLQAIVQVDQSKHAGGVQGLMGNFNGNDSDDFVARNGTQLPAGSSERQLFDFGQSWRLLPGDASHLPYPAGTARADFCNETFVPVFVEDYRGRMLELFSNNTELMLAANSTCQNANEALYLSCMYDAAQLQTLSAAEEAALQTRQEALAKDVVKNTPPSFSMPATITVTASSTFSIAVNVADNEGNPVTLSVEQPSNDSASTVWLDAGGQLHWQVGNLSDNATLTVVATDSLGAPAEWTPVVLYCGCANGGACDFGYATSASAAGRTFYKAECSCVGGYQGDSCEVAPCDARPSPCYNETMCHTHSNGSYYCDSCPAGMVGDGSMCEDTNECLETPGICQESCSNLVPGYECSCTTPGYGVSPSNSSQCVDIDECSSGSHSCRADGSQVCHNTDGGYRCNCTSAGYAVNVLGECQDVDECKATVAPCASGMECVNTPGSYQCACAYGQVKTMGACKAVIEVGGDGTSTGGNSKDTVIVIVASVVGGLVLIGITAVVIFVVISHC